MPTSPIPLPVALFAAFTLLGTSNLPAQSYRVTIAASDAERTALLVSFPLPANAPEFPRLRNDVGWIFPLQVEDDGIARFIVPHQGAGESLAFALVEGEPTDEYVTVARARADLGVNVLDRRVLVYQTDKGVLPRPDIDPIFTRAGYLHPVFSPSGAVVTGDYPSNHAHHHGIWTSWSKVLFQGRETNFWEMAQQRGTTEFQELGRAWNGPVHGGFVARQQMIDFTAGQPTVALNETWTITAYHVAYASPAARVFDLHITQTCATTDPVVLPKHLYGGLGFRGRDEWNGKENLVLLTSEGATTRETANMTRVRWIYLGGIVERGAMAGVTILSHPGNIRAPEAIRVHPEMPFLSYVPVQSDDMRIEPGRPFVALYRFVITDGTPDRARLDAYWNGFAQPAQATVEAR